MKKVNKVNVDKARQKLLEMRIKIGHLLHNFTVETGLTIDGIDITPVKHYSSNEPIAYIINIETKLT